MSNGETQEAMPTPGIRPRLNFRDDNRTLHLQLLHEWLAPDLREAPCIDWSRLPSKVIGYLIKTVETSPFAGSLALAAGILCGAVSSTIFGLSHRDSIISCVICKRLVWLHRCLI